MRHTTEQPATTRPNAYLRANGSIDTEAVREHARKERARVVGVFIDRMVLPLPHRLAHCWYTLRRGIAVRGRRRQGAAAKATELGTH